MYTVFIVDDEPLIREGLRMLIDWESLGFSVISDASSAEDAIEPVIVLNPDLLITDVKLPGISGITMIQTLRQRGFQGEVFVISGYADFSYAKGAIRYGVKSYLLKPIDERELIGELYSLKSVLSNKNSQRIETTKEASVSHQWFAFLHGQIGLQGNLQTYLPGNRAVNPWLQIITINASDNHQSALSEDPISNVMNAHKTDGLRLLYSHGSQAALLSALPEQSLKESLYMLMEALNQNEAHAYICSVGMRVSSVDDLPASFSSAQSLWAHRFLYSADKPLWYQEPVPSAEDYNDDPSYLSEQFNHALLYNSKEEISSLLKKWQRHCVQAQSDEVIIKVTYSNFMQHFLSSLSEKYPDITGNLTDTQTIVKQIYLSRNIDELTSRIEHRLHEIADALVITLPESPMLRAVDYIEHHYMNRLTVDSVAQALHYNSAYFGRKFKHFAGETFQAYLEKVRLEHAKDLIMEGYKVYQVSTMIGFSSVDYFTEKFRQYTSLTPSQFRQQYSLNAKTKSVSDNS